MTRTCLTLRAAALLLLAVGTALLPIGCGHSKPADPLPDMAKVALLRKSTKGDETGGASQTASTGAGWGTLKGRFVFDGEPPKMTKLDVNKDVEVCGKHNLVDESIVVGSNKGVANVAIYLRSKSRVNPDAGAGGAVKPVYDNRGCRFEPHVLGVLVGTSIVIRNSDPVGHNSNGSPQGDTPFNPLLPANGGEFDYTFKRAQPKGVPVTCSIHPWMKGYLLPRDNPYFAVTKDDGSFEIKLVPAGEDLEFQLWHERADAGLEPADGSWPKGRKKLKIPADGVLDLGELKITAAALK